MHALDGKIKRRQFGSVMGAVAAMAAVDSLLTSIVWGSDMPRRKFTLDLSPGAIGVKANQRESISLAAKHGFESVYANAAYLASLDDGGRQELGRYMQERGIVWGAAGLPVEFRADENRFQEDLKQLPRLAEGLRKSGVTRVGTWLRPYHDELTYVSNFRQHTRRLRECIRVLNDNGLRFGMEYVGPRTLWAAHRYSFIHSMAETKELIAEINQPNVGFVLDSWHWYTAAESANDLKSLRNEDIVACDLNDAPKGLTLDNQIDSQRELPTATGVIDLKLFLSTLVDIGYDGPIRAEPFNASLNQLENDEACKATAAAMKAAFAHVEP